MQIGREDTPEQSIDRLVEVFRELRRVLKDDGTFWLNIADTYCGTGMKAGCKQKDLIDVYKRQAEQHLALDFCQVLRDRYVCQ